ncbi:MAG: hypothetical protein Ct9H90mP30_6760 [Actinomycetota bacterium]|nr:MAG: hypothetical protein Ct9H90mP30_6760 [Actinomycetota bacterium]
MVTMCFLQKMLGYGDKYGIRVDYASITRVQASKGKVHVLFVPRMKQCILGALHSQPVTETCMKPDD